MRGRVPARDRAIEAVIDLRQDHTGFGSPAKRGSSECHGAQLRHGAQLQEAEVKAARAQLAWEHRPFEIPQDIYGALAHGKQQ